MAKDPFRPAERSLDCPNGCEDAILYNVEDIQAGVSCGRCGYTVTGRERKGLIKDPFKVTPRTPPASRDLLTIDPNEWIPEREFKRYANRHGLRGYQVIESWSKAHGLALLHGGHAFTEHSGEGNSTFYQRGPGAVDVVGYMVLLPVDLPNDRDEASGACRVWWTGSPGHST